MAIYSPVFLPGESHGQRNLASYSPWDCKESDTTEGLTHTHTHTHTHTQSVQTWGQQSLVSILSYQIFPQEKQQL